MPFLPGNKYGNHNNHQNAGRRAELPKEVVALVIKDTPKFIQKLIDIALGLDKKMAMAAIDMLLQRVYGQPKQYVETEGVQEHNIAPDLSELLRNIAERISGKNICPPTTGGQTGVCAGDNPQ